MSQLRVNIRCRTGRADSTRAGLDPQDFRGSGKADWLSSDSGYKEPGSWYGPLGTEILRSLCGAIRASSVSRETV